MKSLLVNDVLLFIGDISTFLEKQPDNFFSKNVFEVINNKFEFFMFFCNSPGSYRT